MFFIPAIGIVALVAVFAWRTTDRHVAAFARNYQIPLTERTIEPLRASIQRSRRVRWVCGAVAAAVSTTARVDVGFWGFVGALAVGFGIGSIIDELTRRTPTRQPRAGASLEARSVRNYAERWVLVVLVLALALVAFEGWRALVVDRSTSFAATNRSDAALAGLIALAAATAVVGAVAINRIVQHQAPADSVDLQMLRHGIRVAGVLSVIGAELVVISTAGLSLTAFTFNAAQEVEPFNWLHTGAAIAFTFTFFLGAMLSIRAFPSGRFGGDLPDLPSAQQGTQAAA